jgi:hypothetical protein
VLVRPQVAYPPTTMRLELMDDLEEFVRTGKLWSPDDLQAMVDRLTAEAEATADELPGRIGRFLESVLLRMRLGDVPVSLACDIEGIVYPRLWKVMEGVRDGMPDGELRTRIEVMNRRLSRLFAAE